MRLDRLLTASAHLVAEQVRQNTGLDLWNGEPALGATPLKELVEQAIDHYRIPWAEIDLPATVLRNVLKVLPEAPRARRRRCPREVA